MDLISRAKKGGKIRGKQQRDKALELYYKDPNFCNTCGETIHVGENQKVSSVRKKKFCNQSCAAKKNNLGVRRNKKVLYKEKTCSSCNTLFKVERTPCGEFSKNKYCGSCKNDLPTRTKGEVFNKHSSWTYARSTIGSHARNTYTKSGKGLFCFICGYNLHVDICHIKSVSEFSDDSQIREINSMDNLVALCKNHHWEFDNGLLDLS
jgi:hypothetical protein